MTFGGAQVVGPAIPYVAPPPPPPEPPPVILEFADTFTRSVSNAFGTSEFVIGGLTPVWGALVKNFGDEVGSVNGSAADVAADYTGATAHYAESKIDVRSNAGNWALPLEVYVDWASDGQLATSTRRAACRVTIAGHTFEMLVSDLDNGATLFPDGAQLGPIQASLGGRIFTGPQHYDATVDHGEFFAYRSPWNTPLRLRARIEDAGGGVMRFRIACGFADETPPFVDSTGAGSPTDDDMTLRLTPWRNVTAGTTRHTTADKIAIVHGVPGLP